MAPVLNAWLHTSEICQNIQRNVVHGLKEGHALDVPNLYIYQGTQRIEYYVNQILDKNSICGKLLRTLSEQTKLELGISKSLFNKDYKII